MFDKKDPPPGSFRQHLECFCDCFSPALSQNIHSHSSNTTFAFVNLLATTSFRAPHIFDLLNIETKKGQRKLVTFHSVTQLLEHTFLKQKAVCSIPFAAITSFRAPYRERKELQANLVALLRADVSELAPFQDTQF